MIEENMQIFCEDMERDIKYYSQHLETMIDKSMDRADEFIDENVSIFKPKLLMDSREFQKEFIRCVLSDLHVPIDDTINDMSNVVSKRARQQAKSVIEYVGSRPKRANISGAMIGSINFNSSSQESQFDQMRQEFLERLRRDSNDVLRRHDQLQGIKTMSTSIKQALMQTAALQVASAASIGGLVAMQMLDITGVVLSTSMAVMGLAIVPWRRSVMRYELI